MFWLARLMRLARPIPPTPTPAMLRVSLGGTRPRPRTWRGTMQNAAAVTAESASNLRREMVLFSVMESPLRAARLARAQAKFTVRARIVEAGGPYVEVLRLSSSDRLRMTTLSDCGRGSRDYALGVRSTLRRADHFPDYSCGGSSAGHSTAMILPLASRASVGA